MYQIEVITRLKKRMIYQTSLSKKENDLCKLFVLRRERSMQTSLFLPLIPREATSLT
jgi:hypothetical protein